MLISRFLASVWTNRANGVPDTPDSPDSPYTAVRQWACNGNVPAYLGRLNCGLAMLVMEVAGSRVTVRLRPDFLARLGGVQPLIAEPDSGLAITTKQGALGRGQYICFLLPGWRPYRLWIPSRHQAQSMLSCLADAGFVVPAVESR